MSTPDVAPVKGENRKDPKPANAAPKPDAGPKPPNAKDAAGAVERAKKNIAADEAAKKKKAMKPLLPKYAAQERDVAADKRQVVKLEGQDAEIRRREWAENSANVGTVYMNDQQRKDFAVTAKPQTDASGHENAAIGTAGNVPKNFQGVKGADGKTTRAFVVDGEGQIYAGGSSSQLGDDGQKRAVLHHSSFLAGGAVAGAGEVRTDEQGTVKSISNRSGHYHPGEEQSQQSLDAFEKKGVNLDNVKFENFSAGKDRTGNGQATVGMATEFRRGGEKTFENRHAAVDEMNKGTGSKGAELFAKQRAKVDAEDDALVFVEDPAPPPPAAPPPPPKPARSVQDHTYENEPKPAAAPPQPAKSVEDHTYLNAAYPNG